MSAIRRGTILIAIVVAFAAGSPAQAIHFYRGPGGGCTPADGALSDGGGGAPAGTIQVLHNTFNDAATGLPVTVVPAGSSLTWTWNSAHCHSVKASGGQFYSGFHYPTTVPTSPAGVPGFFDYPVLESNPTLSYSITFTDPGIYTYFCEHHQAIGMNGIVIVQ